ncbi:hypothetical protein ACE193_01490 [Bernardetia sp. OM2101]|uniref:hypothetical protein n=1 Tax=Bernardetia sp. OM2101 TaxID=3344876 RepID=UPI0035D0CDD2
MRVLLFLFLLIPLYSFGQNITDSLLATFYNKTLSISFLNKTENEPNNRILIRTEFDKNLLIQQNNLNQFIFFDKKTSYHSVLSKPFKKNAGKMIYHISHKFFGSDTVDINIGSWVIKSISRKKIALAANCGGTMGYIPDARFIFDRDTKKWNLITGKEIREQKRAELRRFFNKEIKN